MIESLVQRLVGLDVRLVRAVLFGLFVLLGFEAWMLVLRAPLAEHRTLAVSGQALRGAVQGGSLAGEIARLQAEIDANAAAFAGGSPARSDDDTVLMLIDTLSRLAPDHAVVLGRVTAGRRGAVGDIEERCFDVEARGDYLGLQRWLAQARPSLGALVVSEMTLRPVDDDRRIALSLRLAAYRPIAAPAGTP